MKSLIVVFFFLFAVVIRSQAQENYQAFEEKGKWGFKQGKKMVIKPRFDDVANFWASSPHTKVRIGNKFGVIDRKGNWFIPPDLDSIHEVTFPHNYDLDGQWHIAYGKEYDYILNGYDYSKLDSFQEIQRLIQVREKNPYFNADYSDARDEYEVYLTTPEEPYVIVSNFDERKQPVSAVYELKERKLISPWTPLNYGETITVEVLHMDTMTLYVYSNGVEKGYYMTGMEYGTAFKFSDFAVEDDFILLRQAKAGADLQLYQWTGEHLLLLSGTNKVSVSWEEGSARYFYLLDDGNGKYGFVSMGGKVVEPRYDTLFHMPGYSDVLHSRINTLYGMVSTVNDFEVKPLSLEPFEPQGYDYLFGSKYLFFPSGIYFAYTDQSGRRIYTDPGLKKQYNFNPRHVFGKKAGDFSYLYSYDSIRGVRKEVQVSDAKYLSIEPLKEWLFKARGVNKKYGFLSPKGDTLVPFEFDHIDMFNWDGDGHTYIRVGKNGKKAMYCLWTRELVPVFYEDIRETDMDDYSNLILTVKDKRFGVNAVNGAPVLDQVYEQVLCMHSHEEFGDFLLGLKNKRYSVGYMPSRFRDSASAPLLLKEYDFILKDAGYVKQGDKYEMYSLFDHTLKRLVTPDEITWREKNFTIAFREGKFGIYGANAEILLPFDYELVDYTRINMDPLRVYAKGQKYFVNMETWEITPDPEFNASFK